ncbi:DUF1707 domain-containing protein [Actinomadura harenae]|uniref:DUF1707 domain-containing protein n=2 Tax=Actinomadura harenae TaxID=2483351 RepID=A0A3M2M331_9ACTN|nr:DUF1707 domain-containing protein [Actinomadura harenae]
MTVRASDADRDQVIEQLRAAIADGRLDPAEFDERVDAALTARTLDALTPLVTDLVVRPGSGAALTPPSAGPPAELLTIKERHGSVRRDGAWELPRRLELRTKWSDVLLDLSTAVYSLPELVIDLRVQGGDVELVLAPGMMVDANGLSARHSTLSISRGTTDHAPRTLHVHLIGRIRHAHLDTRWHSPTP